MKTLVTASHVIGYDPGTDDHVLLRDAQVVYEGNRIVHVGHGHDPAACDEVLDAGLALVGPGFVDLDALADIDHALLDTWHADGRGLQWSEEYALRGPVPVFDAEDRAFLRAYALTQLVRNGITTAMPIAAETHGEWAETYDDLVSVADSAARIGLRMYLGPSYRAGVPVVTPDGERAIHWRPERGDEGLAEAVRFVRDVDGAHDGLIRGALLPCRIETLTPELMRATARAAEELDCPVRLHCLQGTGEREELAGRHGTTPLGLLEETGLLGRRLLVPHAVYIGGHSQVEAPYAGELDALARIAGIVHCPHTMVRYGAALEDFDRYRAAGVNIAMGTDSFPPDMIRNMDYGTNLSKLTTGRPEAGSAADYYRAATLGGARALGRDDLGRLAPGALADLVVVRLDGPRTGPVDDPIRTLLMNASGADVDTVVIDGRTVLAAGRVPGVDETAWRTRAQGLFDRMKNAYAGRDYRHRATEELFPDSFPAPGSPGPAA
ncbi:chlorohydrolase family protein [Streptomyces omiyaensis]|uniref:chlorohydrolase family protein n=1 Tax=Streptomyces omiyaensis TaxID=68247 RepID=UPI00167A16C6|nr:chlorohydrolase family protein [Streptomyces omiyaensis]GGY59746.1 ethylammeline chlorohydrolase [Streptomyces omiyaensis]